MLSSNAEHFYWLSRYAERAENTARLLNVNLELMLDFPGDKSTALQPVIEITGNSDLFKNKYSSYNHINVMNFLGYDKNNPNSIFSSLLQAQFNSKYIRDNLPKESSEQLNLLIDEFIKVNASKSIRKRTSLINKTISNIQLFFGNISDNYFIGTEYQFIKIGRFIERGDMISRIIDAQCIKEDKFIIDEEFPTLQWTSILRSLSAYEAYRISKRTISRSNIINFLIKNEGFSKSILRCTNNVNQALNNLPRSKAVKLRIKKYRKSILRARTENYSDSQLHDFMDFIQRRILEIDKTISANYF